MKAFTNTTRSRWTAIVVSGLLALGLTSMGQASACEPEYGRIEVTKIVTGDNAPTGIDFGICITGPAPDTTQQCHHVQAGDTTTFDQLQPGTYTLTETNPGTNWTTTYTDTTLTVTADTTTTATITNTWDEPEPEPEYGRIEVTKIVTGDNAPTGIDFEICITGPAPDTTQQCHHVQAGDTTTFDQLQPGTYTLTETNPGTNWTTTYTDTTLTVTADTTTTATITNNWELQASEPPATTIAPAGETITPPSTKPLPATGQDGRGYIVITSIATALVAIGGALVRSVRRPQRSVT